MFFSSYHSGVHHEYYVAFHQNPKKDDGPAITGHRTLDPIGPVIAESTLDAMQYPIKTPRKRLARYHTSMVLILLLLHVAYTSDTSHGEKQRNIPLESSPNSVTLTDELQEE